MHALLAVIAREVRALRENSRLIALAVCAPPLFGLIITWQYAEKKLVSIPVTIVDQDHSAMSRGLTRALLANEAFSLGQYAGSPDEFPGLAAQNLSHICFVFPRNLERALKAGRGARVAVMTDATNILSGNIAQTASNEVFATFSVAADIKRTEARGLAPAPWAGRVALPLSSQFRSWFNPNFNNNYADYLCLGALIVPVQLASLLIACRSGAREFDKPARDEIATLAPHPLCLVLGKSIVYTALVWPGCLLTLHIPHWWLGVPMHGSEALVAWMVACFSAMLTTLAFGLSALTRMPLMASLLSAVLTLPNFLLCGYTWPNFAIPPGLHFLSYAFPMYQFAFAFRKVALMGAGWKDCGLEIQLWLAWSAVAFLLALLGAHMILRASRRSGAAA
jgi:ABC-2 type transport system permease protein